MTKLNTYILKSQKINLQKKNDRNSLQFKTIVYQTKFKKKKLNTMNDSIVQIVFFTQLRYGLILPSSFTPFSALPGDLQPSIPRLRLPIIMS